MEHMNRTAKEALGHQALCNPKSVKRIGNSIGLFRNVCEQFDAVTRSHQASGKHVRASEDTDIQKIIQQLLAANVFRKTAKRCHEGFEMINGKSLTGQINAGKFDEWLYKYIHRLCVNYKRMTNIS